MIIASDKLIIQPDETLNAVIAGRHEAIAVSHSCIKKAAGNAARIAYDATSQKAVNTLLSVDTSGKIVYPLLEYNVGTASYSPVSLKRIEKVYGSRCVSNGIDVSKVASAMFSLVNNLVYTSKHRVNSKSKIEALYDNKTVYGVDLKTSGMDYIVMHTENRGITCDDLAKYSDVLFRKGWIILGLDVAIEKQYNHYTNDIDVIHIGSIKLHEFNRSLSSENIVDITDYTLRGRAWIAEETK